MRSEDKLLQPPGGGLDPVLREALVNFRASVNAWSVAEMSRPRSAATIHRGISWRLAAAVALGCLLLVGGVSGGVYRQHLIHARVAAAETERQQQLAASRAHDDEDLLARVDSDVSRQVPSAMEPLAQLMDEQDTQ